MTNDIRDDVLAILGAVNLQTTQLNTLSNGVSDLAVAIGKITAGTVDLSGVLAKEDIIIADLNPTPAPVPSAPPAPAPVPAA